MAKEQFLYLPDTIDPITAKKAARSLIKLNSPYDGEKEYVDKGLVHGVRKISASPKRIASPIQEVAEVQQRIRLVLMDLGLADPEWCDDSINHRISSLAQIALPGGHFDNHQDRLSRTRIFAITSLMGTRRFRMTRSYEAKEAFPAPHEPEKIVDVQQGGLLVVDGFANPWHSTVNQSELLGVNLLMYEL